VLGLHPPMMNSCCASGGCDLSTHETSIGSIKLGVFWQNHCQPFGLLMPMPFFAKNLLKKLAVNVHFTKIAALICLAMVVCKQASTSYFAISRCFIQGHRFNHIHVALEDSVDLF